MYLIEKRKYYTLLPASGWIRDWIEIFFQILLFIISEPTGEAPSYLKKIKHHFLFWCFNYIFATNFCGKSAVFLILFSLPWLYLNFQGFLFGEELCRHTFNSVSNLSPLTKIMKKRFKKNVHLNIHYFWLMAFTCQSRGLKFGCMWSF